ncbi:hypothetical protein [Sphingomonas sp. BK580]|uniref:hypothetical protein n=1 Tax=Sphingomonas sp. BK580 TaxID=2586972 RepID=UPI0016161738|nr:hypothetical protein [Sphingomonas sp. BK580]MBB3695786.1 hypothetical protein [Sphingomonas sp. BK580]
MTSFNVNTRANSSPEPANLGAQNSGEYDIFPSAHQASGMHVLVKGGCLKAATATIWPGQQVHARALITIAQEDKLSGFHLARAASGQVSA